MGPNLQSRRFNEITYHGVKLLSLYTIMLGKELPPFDRRDGRRLVNQCFFAVSVQGKQKKPVSPQDPRLRKALEEYQNQLPNKDYQWPSRDGLNQSLTFHIKTVMADIRRHIVVHLVERITKYATVSLTTILNLSEVTVESTVVKQLARRLTKRLVYNEKQAFAIAKAKGEEPPPLPLWIRPTDVNDILGLSKDSANQNDLLLLSLLRDQRKVGAGIQTVFNAIVHRVEPDGGLPICSSKAADKYNEKGKENPWLKRYYPLHRFMLRELEQMGKPTDHSDDGVDPPSTGTKVVDKPVSQVHYAWARRKVVKICGRHPDIYVSRRSKRRAIMALLKAINSRSPVKSNIKGKVVISRITLETP